MPALRPEEELITTCWSDWSRSVEDAFDALSRHMDAVFGRAFRRGRARCATPSVIRGRGAGPLFHDPAVRRLDHPQAELPSAAHP
ncbi:MAG: hypothetical protein ACLRWP_17815 [Bilophila wadsworthia]